MMSANGQPVIVTINPGLGVFCGILEDYDRAQKACVLTRIRMVLTWEGTRGYLGLSQTGPDKGSHLSARGPRAELQHVESITECTAEAWAALDAWPGA